MNGNEHGRAMELLTLRDVEGLSDGDARWLESHLAGCAECSEYELAMGSAEQAMRSFTVMARGSLVASTQAKVRARAEQLREHQARMVLIGVSFCLGVVTSTLTAWVWWKCGAWVADKLGLPAGIVEPGVLLFWLLPAVAVAFLMAVVPPARFEGSIMQRFLSDRMGGAQ